MSEASKNLAEVILSGAQLVALVAGGLWVYFRFLRERTHQPRIFFGLHCDFHGPQSGFYVAAFEILIRNEGLVKQNFTDIRLRVRGIARGSGIEEWNDDRPRVAFPLKLIEAQVIYKRKFGHIFVEPGIEQPVSYVARVPEDILCVLARAEFVYEDRRRERTHSIERVFTLPSEESTDPPRQPTGSARG